jgi:DNA-3-methyladenine glycosylase
LKLQSSFYKSNDVVYLAKQLLGKSLKTNIDGVLTGGIITETEAYAGITDRASHAYGGRRTSRTEVMFQEGGLSYVYLCYGVHFLFNVVTGEEGIPHAVLIRAISPIIGIDEILKRRKKSKLKKDVTDGPGKLTKALGISLKQNGSNLEGDTVWIEESGLEITETDILISKRIGVDYAGEDANLPYRFQLAPNLLDKKNAPKFWSVV